MQRFISYFFSLLFSSSLLCYCLYPFVSNSVFDSFMIVPFILFVIAWHLLRHYTEYFDLELLCIAFSCQIPFFAMLNCLSFLLLRMNHHCQLLHNIRGETKGNESLLGCVSLGRLPLSLTAGKTNKDKHISKHEVAIQPCNNFSSQTITLTIHLRNGKTMVKQ